MQIDKRILASVFVIAMLAFSLGYGAYSYFNDVENSKGNYFEAGTLDLKVDGKDDPLGQYFEVGNVKPGDSGYKVIELSNLGTLDGKAWLKIVGVADEENGLTEPELELGDTDAKGELCDNLYIMVWIEKGGEEGVFDNDDVLVVEGFRSAIEGTVHIIGVIPGEQSIHVCFYWEIPKDVGNIIQSDYCEFNLLFGLDQA